jgi:anaerobic ribonucleoside-triphosphate reductase
MEKRENPVQKAIKAIREIPEKKENKDPREKRANEEIKESPERGVQRALLVHKVHRAPKDQKVL